MGSPALQTCPATIILCNIRRVFAKYLAVLSHSPNHRGAGLVVLIIPTKMGAVSGRSLEKNWFPLFEVTTTTTP